ncbi:TrmB family transcriptional regulator [bacterium]|nr:TrmB family transcriptional regulator [bacterium]
MEELVEKLKELGFNSYEAKVYIALLKKYPATGYEVSKLADIPQARAYDTLKALENDHIVTSSPTKPISYTPIKPKEMIKQYRRKYASTLDFLDKKLPNVKDNYTEPVLNLNGHHTVNSKILEIIRNAKKEIFIAAWSQDFKNFEADLLEAYHRGLEIKIVGYDAFVCNFGSVSRHVTGKEIIPTMGGRMIFVAADNAEGVFGQIAAIDKTTEASVLWTKNEEIVFLIKAFIVQDMYITDIAEQFPEQLKYFYGTGLKKLKDKVMMGSEFIRK